MIAVTKITVPVMKPRARLEVSSASAVGRIIAGTMAMAALSSEARMTNTAIVQILWARPPMSL